VSDEETRDQDEVEAHKHALPKSALPASDEGDDVEAHKHALP
jgi:hypothetical protein